eukprot:6280809-Alexandrium_andersonii.AAC.1
MLAAVRVDTSPLQQQHHDAAQLGIAALAPNDADAVGNLPRRPLRYELGERRRQQRGGGAAAR